MPNPFNALNPGNPMNANKMGNLRNMYQSLVNSRNPMALFQQMAYRNPSLQPIAQALGNGANPQQIFNNLCSQRGIDPQEFLRQITGNNGFKP